MIRTMHASLVLLLALAISARADYYVDGESGEDANPGTAAQPFKTIQKGIDTLPQNSQATVFVNAGVYSEPVVANKSGMSLVGIGTVVVSDQTTGILVYGSSVVIQNFTVSRCTRGLFWSGADTLTVRRCRFVDNVYGAFTDGSGTNIHIEGCDFCCSNSTGLYLYTGKVVVERCSIVGNGLGIDNWGQNLVDVRDCIVASNSSGITSHPPTYAVPTLESNDFFGNGASQDYVNTAAGSSDVSTDPRFVDGAHRNYALEAASPLINAGKDQDGMPVTIGAHDIGVLSSSAAEATVLFSGWTDAAGNLVTSPSAQVVVGADGNIHLNAVATASALSPVIDLGDSAALTSTIAYRAVEDFMRPTGSKRVVDANNATFAREIEVRTSDTAFGALDGTPAWTSTTGNAALNKPGRYVQLRLTLTTQGK